MFQKMPYPNPEVFYAGPQPLIRESATGFQKRLIRKLGSSEHNTLLEDEQIYNDDFRCGGPHLVRLPALNRHLKDGDPLHELWKKELERPVRQILDRWEVMANLRADGNAYLVWPMRRADRADPETWYDTITISSRKKDPAWYHACKEIHELFVTAGHSKLNIDMLDVQNPGPMLTYPIAHHDPFCRHLAWPQVKVLEVLGDRKWTSVSVLRRGRASNEKPITISMTVKEESPADWLKVGECIVAVLEREGLSDVAVEMRWDSALQSSADPEQLSHRDWSLKAKLGGSLGIAGSAASSPTFGGFVELEFAGGTQRVGPYLLPLRREGGGVNAERLGQERALPWPWQK
jgi:hypothetical protein